MNFDLTKMATFGVAGNFTGHLEQAGEDKDFKNIKTNDENAPKAIFPTYIPNAKSPTPDFLTIFPFDSKKIIYPHGEQKIQLEPECAIIFNVQWNKNKIQKLEPLCFAASNDCSIRKEGASKISEKKNWGKSSKGVSDNFIKIDNFSKNGILNRYRIASFMIRDKKVFTYGEDSAIRDYNYIFEKLNSWMIDKLNNQKDQNPAENLNEYLVSANCPLQIMISIGATRYTDFGKTNFLLSKDESVVILYPEDKFSFEEIKQKLENDETFENDISVLRQVVVV